jgi:uracil-DNA glycosylase
MTAIVLVGEALGETEVRYGQNFVGPSGIELIRMLGESGIIALSASDRDFIMKYYSTQDPAVVDALWRLHPEVYRTNVFNLHPPGNDLEEFCGPKSTAIPGYPALTKSKYVRHEFAPELDRLADDILRLDPNLIVCLGNTPLWALAGRSGITKLRGTTLVSTHTVVGYKLLASFHPAYVLRQYESRPIVIADLMKAARESLYPELRRPAREIWIEPSLEDIELFIARHIARGNLLSVDIETAGDRITCIGLAPSAALGIVIPFDDERKPSRSYWDSVSDESRCWRLIRAVLQDPGIPKLFQNGLYDIAFLWRSMKIKVLGASEDTMLLHHALQPEMLKGLGFLGSIYSDQGAWKNMRRKDETIKRDS